MFQTIDFYPTENELARFMAEKLGRCYSVLDPSAGTGNLLKAYDYDAKKYAVEISPDLCVLLRELKYNVFNADFLTWQTDRFFDGIIMNPPFSAVEKHVLKAWDILEHGNLVACVPKHALQGKDRYECLLLKLIEDYGEVFDVGRPFQDAEVKSSVECCVIVLRKSENPAFNFSYKNRKSNDLSEVNEEKALMSGDYATSLVSTLQNLLELYKEYYIARKKIIATMEWFGHLGADAALETANSSDIVTSYNSFLDQMLDTAWNKVYKHPKLSALLTFKAEKDIERFRASQGGVDFNLENIASLIIEIEKRSGSIVDACISEVFDWFTKYHPDNREYVEGWKSNECWRVGKRIVLPQVVDKKLGSYGIDLAKSREIDDMDRAMCVVTGTKFDSILPSSQILSRAIKEIGLREKIETTFFVAVLYAKGTMHLYWKDEEVRKKFNFMAAKAKKWLPPAEDDV